MPPCPLCDAESRSWFELERGLIVRCTSDECGLGWLVAQPDDATLEKLYDEFYYPEHGGAGVFANSSNAKYEQHYKALDRLVSLRGKRLLDYGCGAGGFLHIARREGAEAMGIEFDDTGRQIAARDGLTVVKSLADVDDATFDFIYMNDVIEHLRNPVAELALLRERLRPGGSIFVVTMNMRSVSARLRRARWHIVTNPTHLWFYDETSLSRTLITAGFVQPTVQRWAVVFDHHGRLQRRAQQTLQQLGLDGSLRFLAQRPKHT